MADKEETGFSVSPANKHALCPAGRGVRGKKVDEGGGLEKVVADEEAAEAWDKEELATDIYQWLSSCKG